MNKFIKTDRKIEKKEEFNLWLKETGITFEVWIEQTGSNPRQRGNANNRFSTGLGMYDFITGKYRGLDQREEGLVAFGMNPEDLKEANKDIADRDERFKEMSLEVGRDLRFPKPKKETKKYPLTFESDAGKEIIANKGLLKTPLGKKLVKQMEKNAANTPK